MPPADGTKHATARFPSYPPVLRATAGGREASMSNIIFWTALVVVPILVGTAYAYLRHFHHEDDF
ncbi:predicted protein [Brucella sp. 83/13]|nr:predicted protein [Brucella sp. 83/13]